MSRVTYLRSSAHHATNTLNNSRHTVIFRLRLVIDDNRELTKILLAISQMSKTGDFLLQRVIGVPPHICTRMRKYQRDNDGTRVFSRAFKSIMNIMTIMWSMRIMMRSDLNGWKIESTSA